MTEPTTRRRPKGFWLTIPSGMTIHVLGDPDMSQETLNALAEMAKAAGRMAAAKDTERRGQSDG